MKLDFEPAIKTKPLLSRRSLEKSISHQYCRVARGSMTSVPTYQDTSDLARKAFSSWEGHRTWARILDELPKLRVYLAGGVVRDVALGQPCNPKDFDLFLGGECVDEALTKLAEAGRLVLGPFGSPRWFPNSNPTIYADVIPIARFHNGLWSCRDIVDVLNQFDFTGNAVAVEVRTGAWSDPQNGHRDLSERTLRAVRFDYPNEAISQGANLTRHEVMFFRFLHYAAHCDLRIEPFTLAWLLRHREFIAQAEAFEATFFSLHPNAFDVLNGALHGG